MKCEMCVPRGKNEARECRGSLTYRGVPICLQCWEKIQWSDNMRRL